MEDQADVMDPGNWSYFYTCHVDWFGIWPMDLVAVNSFLVVRLGDGASASDIF